MRLHPNSLIRFLSSTDRTSAVLSLFLLRSSGRRNSTSAISFLLYFFLRIFLHFFLCIPYTLWFHIHLSIRSRAGVHFWFVVTMHPDIAFIEIVFVMLLAMILVIAHISMMSTIVPTLVSLVMIRLVEIEMLHIPIHLIYTE